MDDEQIQTLTRKVDALADALAGERGRHLAGIEPEPALLACFEASPEACDPEVAAGLKGGGHRALSDRVTEGWVGRRLAPLEEAWRAAESSARVGHSPDGSIPLATAELELARQPDRTRRLALAAAVAEALEGPRGQQDPRRQQGPARHREAHAEARARLRAEAGLVPDWGAVVEGDQLLGATDDAWRALRDHAASRTPGLDGAARSDLRRADLLHLAAHAPLDGHFRPSALQAAVRAVVADLGPAAERVRVDEAARPAAWPGAHACGGRVIFRARGGLADWVDLLDAFGRSLAAAHQPPHARDPLLAAALGGLLSGLTLERRWLEARLEVSRRDSADLARAALLRRLLSARCAAAALRVATEASRGLSGQAWREAHREALGAATGAAWDGVRASRDGDAAPLVTAVRGLAEGERLRAGLRERFDEDWWRNPRTREHLAALLAGGRLPETQPASAREAGERLSKVAEAP